MDRDIARNVGRVPHGSVDRAGVLDFSANINPETPAAVHSVYADAFDEARSYPPEPPREFLDAAAEFVGCPPDHIIPTPGGLAAIRLVVSLTLGPGDSVLVPTPSFGEYEREVRIHGGDPVFVDHEAILETSPEEHALVIVCQPNNPTGTAYAKESLREYAKRCREAGTTLLIDEAFIEFTDRASMAGEQGVIVARSLTKIFGLPGLRTGFAVATSSDQAALEGARRPWNVGVPALAVGGFCLKQEAFVQETKTRVVRERKRMRERLEERYEVYPSEAPFLLLEVRDGCVDDILRAAREAGIAIRDARSFRGLDTHVRVAVRLPQENERLLEVLLHV